MNQSSEIIADLLAQTQKLHQLLVRERGILSGPHTANAATLATSKEILMQSISGKMVKLGNVTDDGNRDNPVFVELLELLAQCKIANNENNALVNQRLSIVRQSIGLVRTSVSKDSLQLYTNTGKPSQTPIKRSLTNA